MIYPILPWLTILYSHPINGGRYLISWRGLLGSLGKGIGGCALPVLVRWRTPALNTVGCSKLSAWPAEPLGAPNLGRHDAPDAATPIVEILSEATG